jgi:outer membrane protein OmpA-like peptidoglycan-associated protein
MKSNFRLACKRHLKYPLLCLITLFIVLAPHAKAQERFSDAVGPVTVQEVTAITPLIVPYITWGGEAALFHANGGLTTRPGTLMAELGMNLKLVPGDNFQQQVRDYLAGKSPILRGTFRMIAQASEAVGKDPRTKPVIFGQLTWSAGDHFVGRSNIRKISDLTGKKIAIQKGGPHVGMLYDILKTVRLSKSQVEIVWVDELTGANGPAERFRNDATIAGCFVITPDMIGLTGGPENTGTGAEGTVKGAHVVVSTATLSRSIADVYACRKDFYDAYKPFIERFFAGYLKGAEEVIALKKAYETSGSAKYTQLLTMMQTIYGKEVLPTLEEDAHGLIADCTFVGQPGNIAFFNDPSNTISGFEGFNKAGLDMAVNWGFAKQRYALLPSDLNFNSNTFKSLLATTVSAPTQLKQTRFKKEVVRAEIESFNEDAVLDEKTLISFTIQFDANQNTFSANQYSSEFDRVVELASKYGNAAIAIKGHSDPSRTLSVLVRTGLSKGILKRTGTRGNYRYFMNGKAFTLENTAELIRLIEQKAFGDGSDVESPYQVMRAALKLSEQRGEAVKQAIITYARQKNARIDTDQIVPIGVGIKEPIIPKPTSPAEAAENRRVEFALIKVSAEAVAASDFDF